MVQPRKGRVTQMRMGKVRCLPHQLLETSLHLQTPNTQLSVPLKPLKDVSVVLMIKALVATRTSTAYHIFELEIELPKFAMYALTEPGAHPEPKSSVTFT